MTNTPGQGFILIRSADRLDPQLSRRQTAAYAAIVPAGPGGGVTVIGGVSGTDLIIDINGYFTPSYNAGSAVIFDGNRSNNWFVWVGNHSLSENTIGLAGSADSVANGSAGVRPASRS